MIYRYKGRVLNEQEADALERKLYYVFTYGYEYDLEDISLNH